MQHYKETHYSQKKYSRLAQDQEYSCQVQGCLKEFKDRRALRGHYRAHHGSKELLDSGIEAWLYKGKDDASEINNILEWLIEHDSLVKK